MDVSFFSTHSDVNNFYTVGTGVQNIPLTFSVIADSSLSKKLSDSNECHFFEQD